MENITKSGKIIFEKIAPSAWEHPADRATLNTLKSIPALDGLLKVILGNTSESAIRLTFLSSAIRINENQLPNVYESLKECCQILDTSYIPEIYVSQDPRLNAGAIGVDKPFIMLNSATIEKLEKDELMYIIGHELGHILSGHGLYRTLAWLLLNLSSLFVTNPVISGALYAVSASLMEWSRKSELSADRAGLLCVQNQDVLFKAMMKMAGGTITNLSIDEFKKQAQDYDATENIKDSVFKVLNVINITHPFPVERVREIQKYEESYKKIISGDYRKRDDKDEDMFKQYESAFKQYKEDLRNSNDPLNRAVSTLAESLEQAVGQMNKTFTNIFTPPKN